MELVDVGDDGVPELILSTRLDKKLQLCVNLGTTFSSAGELPVGDGRNTILVADLNNDTQLDIATTSENTDQLQIFLRTGLAQFAVQVTLDTGDFPVALAAG